MKKIGVALVGLGKYSHEALKAAFKETKLCYLAGVVTGDKEKGKAWAREFNFSEENIYNYEGFDEIKNNESIDAVYIVLPNALHSEYTIRGAQAGKHVFCEKPMAVSVEECEKMMKACAEANKKLYIGYRLHFDPHNLEIKRLGQTNELGDVQYVEAKFGFDVGDPDQWRLNRGLAGGGALVDVGIYCIQAARYIIGKEPIAVRSARILNSNDDKFKEVESDIQWEMEFPDGIISMCSASYSKEFDRAYAKATNGWFELEPAFEYSDLNGRTSNGDMNIDNINQQAVMLDAFADSIINGKDVDTTGEEGLRDVAIIQAIYEAATTGTRIPIDNNENSFININQEGVNASI